MKYIFVSFMVALSVTIFGYALYKYYKLKCICTKKSGITMQ